jgi:hypothetical protein
MLGVLAEDEPIVDEDADLLKTIYRGNGLHQIAVGTQLIALTEQRSARVRT